MTRRYFIFALAALAAFFAVGASIFSLNRSLWFLWAALPPGGIRLAIDQHQSEGRLLAGYLKPYLDPSISQIIKSSDKLAFSLNNDHLVISAVPRPVWSLHTQRAFTRQLRAQGWQVRRYGLAIFAARLAPSDDPPALPNRHTVSAEALRRRWQGDLPSHPLIIAAAKAGISPNIAGPFTLLADKHADELRIAISPSSHVIPFHPIELLIAPDNYSPIMKSDLSLALPSVYYSQLPEDLTFAWRNLLRQKFGFVRTAPNLLTIAPSGNQNVIKIQITGEDATLAIEGNNNAFVKNIQEAVRAEEAYARPERQAFRLPDKTFGFELVPGEPRGLFGDPSADLCRQDFGLWLCQEGERAALSTKAELARQALNAAPVHIHLANKYAQRLLLPLNELTAVSTPVGDIMIKAKLKSK
ncbi:MAG: hypothetical protein HY372_03825 [Candidatus Andersenbacteria bacterium]|nr:hypothetical protein [Candidatus Andersenbacteria bacterium]